MALLWTILVVSFIILEASTTQFICIWFAGGAFAALISAVLGAGVWSQIIVFAIVTIILLALTKKLVKKLKGQTPLKTNIESLIGKTAVVTEEISNSDSKGAVKIDGKVWSARNINEDVLQEGTYVTIEEIHGVKLIVKIKKEA